MVNVNILYTLLFEFIIMFIRFIFEGVFIYFLAICFIDIIILLDSLTLILNQVY
jgi:hypothetical protein